MVGSQKTLTYFLPRGYTACAAFQKGWLFAFLVGLPYSSMALAFFNENSTKLYCFMFDTYDCIIHKIFYSILKS